MLQKKGSKELTWVGVNEVAKDVCPNVLHFVDLLLTLPASSADCERGFSQTKLIKSDWRSKLHDKKMADLLTIELNSPEVAEFDPHQSIQLWLSTRKRRRSFSEPPCLSQILMMTILRQLKTTLVPVQLHFSSSFKVHS